MKPMRPTAKATVRVPAVAMIAVALKHPEVLQEAVA
jgi:hypothetical protein